MIRPGTIGPETISPDTISPQTARRETAGASIVQSSAPSVRRVLGAHLGDAWILDVVAGPGAGRRVRLTGDAVSVSARDRRGGLTRVRIRPASSRTGATLTLLEGRAALDTLAAAGPAALGGGSCDWPETAHLQLSDLRIALRRSGSQGSAATSPGRGGTVLINRAPASRPPSRVAEVVFPEPPVQGPTTPFPWAVVVLPVLLALPIALWWRQPVFAALALLMPTITLTQHRLDVRRRRHEHAHACAQHEQIVRRCEERLAGHRAAETRARHRDHPDLALVAATAGDLERSPGTALWHRRPDEPGLLTARVGLGAAEADTCEVRAGVRRPARLEAVPVTIDLAELGVLGVCGPEQQRTALSRGLLGQLATWVSPQQLRIAVPAAEGRPAPSGHWTGPLPHALPQHAILDDPAGPATERWTLLVLEQATEERRRPPLARALADAAGTGGTGGTGGAGRARTAVIALAADRRQLPLECRAVAELDASGGGVLHRDGRDPQPFEADLPEPRWAQMLAVHLSRLRDATPDVTGSAALPPRVNLLDLVQADPARLADRWLAHGAHSGLRVPLGLGEEGVWWVDLALDGPHLLVAGTTGAGKSELLISLIAALTGAAGPASLALLLVDYKGGAAFGELADLPHVTGVVTDLDGTGSARVLTSLTAELQRRERCLTERGPTPPRLVIVVDEFRVLAEEQPELLSGLVRVATVGRALGVHLVLATQRPAGVIGPQIRANVNLRIALRVRDTADSEEVVECADAARITADLPGRAVVRTGGGPARRVQAAHLPPADRRRWLTAVSAAATLLGAGRAEPPWLPPLPEHLDHRELHEPRPPCGQASAAGRAPDQGERVDATGELSLPYAVADLPERQTRSTRRWAPTRHGQLAVVGGAGSGRSTLLRLLALEAATGPTDVHVHVISGSPIAAPQQWTPPAPGRMGTMVDADDLERCRRLLTLLEQRLRQATGLPVLLIVDGWDAAVETWSRADRGRAGETLLRLAREGGRSGLHVAASGGRTLLSGAASSVFTHRVLLPSSDPSTVMLAGLGPDAVPTPWPPGRALVLNRNEPAVTAQVAWPDPALRAGVPSSEDGAPHSPIRLARLPEAVAATALPRGALGVGGDLGEPLHLPMDAAPVALVCGSAGSGRTTALMAIARAAAAAGRPVVRVDGSTAAGQVQSALACAGERAVLLLDTGWSRQPALESLAAGHLDGDPSSLRVVLAASPGEVILAHRGVLARAREHRTGVLLGSRMPDDGQALGLSLPPVATAVPGRGVLAVRGRWWPIQIGAVDPAELCDEGSPSTPNYARSERQ